MFPSRQWKCIKIFISEGGKFCYFGQIFWQTWAIKSCRRQKIWCLSNWKVPVFFLVVPPHCNWKMYISRMLRH